MATTTSDEFHEIQLNGKQLVFLCMAITVVSVVIFLCGVLVGRGVRNERALQMADGPIVAGEAPTIDEDVPPIPATPNSGEPSGASGDVSYPKLLNEPAPSDRLETPKPAAKTAPAPATPPEKTDRTAKSTPAAAPPPVAKAAEPPPAAATAATSAPAAAKPMASAEPAGAGFAIQVAALRERNEADTVVRRLTGKGYQAYVVTPPPGSAGTAAVYRVRVGKFTERREANQVASRLQKEEQFKPWIVR